MQQRLLVPAFTGLLGLVAVFMPAKPGEAILPHDPEEQGTAQTVAGPNFCSGATLADRRATQPGSLATDPSGAVFAQVGRAEEGGIRRSDQFGSALFRTPLAPGARNELFLPKSGVLAGDGAGGLLVAAGAKVLRLPALQSPGINSPGAGIGFAVEPVAGDPSTPVGRPGEESSGDRGPALRARFTRIAVIASDPDGNVFIADRLPQGTRIRFHNRSRETVTFYQGTPHEISVAPGTVDTVAGEGQGPSADNSPARLAQLKGSRLSLAFAHGRLYIGWTTDGRNGVFMINLTGNPLNAHGVTVNPGAIVTVAGGRPSGFGGDGSSALAARLSSPSGLAADGGGNLYIADTGNNRVRKVDSGGLITTFAGTGPSENGGFNGNYIAAARARLNRPVDVETGRDGSVYISDHGNAQVRVVDRSGIIRPAYGNAKAWRCDKNVPPASAQLSGVTPGWPGESFSADRAGKRVLRTAPGRVETILRAGGKPCSGSGACLEAVALDSSLPVEAPVAVAKTAHGLYVFDGTRVVFINRADDAVRANGVDVPAGKARIVFPRRPRNVGQLESQLSVLRPGAPPPPVAFAADPQGSIYFADTAGLHQVGRSGRLVTLAKIRSSASAECCAHPAAIAPGPDGRLYVADFDQSKIWVFNRRDKAVTVHGATVPPGGAAVIAGNGQEEPGAEDVRATQTSIDGPGGVAADRKGNLYFSESRGHVIRRLDPAGKVTTAAGTGQSGFNGDGLLARLTAFHTPEALAIDGCGDLFIADAGNQRIRRLVIGEGCPASRPKKRPVDHDSGWLSLWVLVAVLTAGATLGYLVSRAKLAKRI